MIENNLKFIIRAKFEAKNLDPINELNCNISNYETILNVKRNVRVVKYDNIIEKKIFASNTKKKIKEYNCKIINNCIIVTNLLDKEIYNDAKILDLYKSRWDIEVFFKYIKNNYKFQHLKEKSQMKYRKMYLCELILTHIAKLIENYYESKHTIKNKKQNMTYKVNYSNLINGIFDSILDNILNGTPNEEILDKFCKSYIKIVQNRKNRSFPRTSKTPFSKWYIKGYSNQTKYMKIIEAILNDKVHELNKNLKTIATHFTSINDIKVKE